MTDGRGTDVRLSPMQPYVPKLWPRIALNTHFWQWQVLQSYRFRSSQHINVLELRSLFNYVRLRGRKLHKHGSRFLVLSDSQVVVSVVAKGRSSSTQLNHVLQRLAALCIAFNIRIIIGWVRSEANPAD
eukprot:1651125-Karenia_brevis.AAC.1